MQVALVVLLAVSGPCTATRGTRAGWSPISPASLSISALPGIRSSTVTSPLGLPNSPTAGDALTVAPVTGKLLTEAASPSWSIARPPVMEQ